MRYSIWSGAVAVVLVLVGPACPAARADEPASPAKPADPVVTKHEATIDGQPVPYAATAGFMRLSNYEGKARADMFYIAYTKEGVTDLAQRPIIFAFNGGPGSSSVWLHLGALGPRRVKMGPEGEPIGPPYEVVDNAETWLGFADLVFIDPISTGYSRAVEGEDPKQFHGLDQDAGAVGDFIRLYTTKNNRWLSPKFLCGESYGTTRAATLASLLQDDHGIYLNGILLVSPVLNFQTLRFAQGNDTPYWLYLPTYTATAWYHKKLAPDLQKDLVATLRKAEAFARDEYLPAVVQGDALPKADREQITREFAALTGLSVDFVERARLRVEIGEFTKELLRSEGKTVGRLDSRYTGLDRDDTGTNPEYDPAMAAITGPYTAAMNWYVRNDLGFSSDLPYEILTGRVHPWTMGAKEEYANVSDRLRGAMTHNRNLRVFIASGYYDLATPHLAARYTFDTMGLSAELRANITTREYRAGHMMYVRDEDRARLRADAGEFVKAALGTPLPASRTLPPPPKGNP